MGFKLFGMIYQRETKDIVKLMENTNREYEFVDLGDGSTKNMEMLVAITGTSVLPQLFDGGESYLGEKQIRAYFGN